MSEEVQNAEKSVARSMVVSLVLNGVLAFAVLLAVLYTKVDYDSVAAAQYPFVLIVAQGTQSLGTGVTMAVVIAILQFAACVGALASSSRIVWSMARDRALPEWQYLRRINPATTIPLTAILTIVVITMALGLINIGSTTIFDAFISLLLEALYLSYLIALVLLLKGRISGRIGPNGAFKWGPWRLPGLIGTLNNIFACFYLVLICFFAFWPSSLPVTPENMNFSVVVTGAVVLFSSIFYFVSARKVYGGPLKEVDVDESNYAA
ncbi:MAG: hypothetical protein LQ340_002178 [Diploschistes diacapsis]|nr:MAG: hypothetical protein LQ340_002178 [Diploschistes diacapsis]